MATQIPLIDASEQNPPEDAKLDHSLHRFETFLRLFGFRQYSFWSFILSWLAFLLVGVAVPILLIEIIDCADCEKYEIKRFEIEILVSESLMAAISLGCVSHSIRKYGVRKFLFVDRYHGLMLLFRDEYIQRINKFYRLLAAWVLPCFLLKAAREITRVLVLHHDPWWKSVVVLLAVLVSWTYSSIILLLGSALFNLVCNLHMIHFENYGKLLERDLDVSAYIDEHIRLTHYLSKISHRFRIYLLLQLLVVTASQFVALLQTTSKHGTINLINGGDFVVCSIVEVGGLVICLHAASKISHRAQALGSVTSRWHAMVTCSSKDAPRRGTNNSSGNLGITNSSGNLEISIAASLPISYSESDLEAVDYVPKPTNTQLASHMSLYQKRQSFVTYMQSNPTGITLYGWTIDRGLVSTICFIEVTLALFVLGKTITFT
ncbi:uncharacterized protein LOC103950043 [Pyrus x bretschneideri]|uniref:uncharacterized protein LOC103950043 n=1 Tax=Pyrus x bretschneideri TaxID=225117 RepID=UPI00202EF1BE|nr:uncharacterized protein LOC103950043 [Pyrus x bretschneideri]XP_009359471.2 uncharacterized protein LOC103950043 [Pyrus x bretschneideri]